MNFLNTIQAYIEQHQLLSREKPIIVGLSGGADSVALLDILLDLGYSCIAAHCNFHLRGEESDRDEIFSMAYARKKGVQYVKTDFDTQKYASENHLSIEMAARELRYTWFETMRVKYFAQAIAVAHHQDDSAETLLLNLVRGTGIKGLTGIKPRNGYVVRPLLSISRNDILIYLDKRHLTYITDSTNLTDAYTRNFIRLKILPLLEELNPSVKTAIIRTADHIKDAEAIFMHVVRDAENKIVRDNKISIDLLKSYPSPKTILYELLKRYGFSRPIVDDIFLSLDKSSGKLFYSSEYILIKDRQFFLLEPNKKDAKIVYFIDSEIDQIDNPINLLLERKQITAYFELEKNKNIAYFDFEKLSFPLVLRHWKDGDSFIPYGMNGRKKISDYFSDHKYSIADKKNCWLLCNNDQVIWIIGERTDNRFRITNSTQTAYIIKKITENDES